MSKEVKNKVKKSKTELTPSQMKKRKKRRNWIIVLAIVILLIIVRLVACSGSGKGTALVKTALPSRGTVEENVSISGTVDSEETKVYFSPVNARIGEVKVAAGDAVVKGDMMIGYDMEDMSDKLAQAGLQARIGSNTYNGAIKNSNENQSKLSEADTNLAVLNKQIEDSEAYLKKMQDALEKSQTDTSNAIAKESLELNQRLAALQKELEAIDKTDLAALTAKQQEIQAIQSAQARNQYASSVAGTTDSMTEQKKKIEEEQQKIADYKEYKAKMESQKNTSEPGVLDSYSKSTQEANYEISSMTMEETQKAYDKAQKGIGAEFNGIVTELTAVEGATVMEGAQLLTLKNSDNLKVVISVTKSDLEKLEVGQKADVTISGNTYQGTLAKINRMASLNQSGAATVTAQIHIDNPDGKIYLGIEAKVNIHTHKADNVLLVPVEAVNADKGGDFVYVVENNLVVKKPVVTGIFSEDSIEIKEGLKETDTVIVTSYSSIEEGTPVAVMPAE